MMNMPFEHMIQGTGHDARGKSAAFEYVHNTVGAMQSFVTVMAGFRCPEHGRFHEGPKWAPIGVLVSGGHMKWEEVDQLADEIFR